MKKLVVVVVVLKHCCYVVTIDHFVESGIKHHNSNPQSVWWHICRIIQLLHITFRGRRGHDRMVVGFTTTCAISVYHH